MQANSRVPPAPSDGYVPFFPSSSLASCWPIRSRMAPKTVWRRSARARNQASSVAGLSRRPDTGRPERPAKPVTGSSGLPDALSTQKPMPPPVIGPRPLGPLPSKPGMIITSHGNRHRMGPYHYTGFSSAAPREAIARYLTLDGDATLADSSSCPRCSGALEARLSKGYAIESARIQKSISFNGLCIETRARTRATGWLPEARRLHYALLFPASAEVRFRHMDIEPFDFPGQAAGVDSQVSRRPLPVAAIAAKYI
jgi:ribosomal protein S27AE